jgi:hypothetical protein
MRPESMSIPTHVLEAWTRLVQPEEEHDKLIASAANDRATHARFPFLARVPESTRSPHLMAMLARIRDIAAGRPAPGSSARHLVDDTIRQLVNGKFSPRVTVALMHEFGLSTDEIAVPHEIHEMTECEKDTTIYRYREAMRRILMSHAPRARVETALGFLEQGGFGAPGPDFVDVVYFMISAITGEDVPGLTSEGMLGGNGSAEGREAPQY